MQSASGARLVRVRRRRRARARAVSEADANETFWSQLCRGSLEMKQI